MMKKYEFDSFSNLRTKTVVKGAKSFENQSVVVIEHQYAESFESKISAIISKIRKGVTDSSFEEGNMEGAINSLTRFVSLMGDSIDQYQDEIQFDSDMTDSIEVTFKGHGITRFNLMFAELNTHEEAYLFYMKNGRPTQMNGSLPLMVSLLKKVLV